jgi:hypothetical protein
MQQIESKIREICSDKPGTSGPALILQKPPGVPVQADDN